MFAYAALHWYADRYNATIVLPADNLLRRAFGRLRRTRFMEVTAHRAYLLFLQASFAFFWPSARSSCMVEQLRTNSSCNLQFSKALSN